MLKCPAIVHIVYGSPSSMNIQAQAGNITGILYQEVLQKIVQEMIDFTAVTSNGVSLF
jgi:hypothetical protein